MPFSRLLISLIINPSPSASLFFVKRSHRNVVLEVAQRGLRLCRMNNSTVDSLIGICMCFTNVVITF
jgi:hypothetical protein